MDARTDSRGFVATAGARRFSVPVRGWPIGAATLSTFGVRFQPRGAISVRRHHALRNAGAPGAVPVRADASPPLQGRRGGDRYAGGWTREVPFGERQPAPEAGRLRPAARRR